MPSHGGSKKFGGCQQKNNFPKTALWGSKKAILGNRCHETACRAAKRQPTGKPKVFRVTSGYGGLMIPLSRVRLSPEKVGVAQKNLILGPILGQKHVLAPPRSLPGIMINMKTLSFWCPVMIVAKNFGGCPQKMDFGPKNSTFGPKKAHFGQPGPKNGLPNGQTATYRKTKGIQSCLMIWGTYDPIESGPSDPKKWGLYGCSVKNADFGQLWGVDFECLLRLKYEFAWVSP